MTILAIDTTNDALAVALYRDGQVIESYVSVNKNKHSTRLMPAIDYIMNDANIKPADLTKIVVAKGPGSYTGVRIALSVAKTMAWTLNIPLTAVSSLRALALNANDDTYVCPFFDARRGLVFTGLYDQAGNIVKEEVNILFEDWLQSLKILKETITFVSPDIDLYRDLIEQVLGQRAKFLPKGHHIINPGLLATIGEHEQAVDPHQLVPNYLRLVEAEVKWLEKQAADADE